MANEAPINSGNFNGVLCINALNSLPEGKRKCVSNKKNNEE